jgi:acetyl-CoA carboxylase beta subunit
MRPVNAGSGPPGLITFPHPPPGFQTSEFLLDHGLIDAIIPRKEMKEQLVKYMDYFATGKKNGAV